MLNSLLMQNDPKCFYQFFLLQVPSSSDFAFLFLENLTKREELLSLNCIGFNIVGDAGSSYTTELERSLSGQSSLDLQENKMYCILGNVHSRFIPIVSRRIQDWANFTVSNHLFLNTTVSG